jgi:hypothetical protein
MLAHASTQSIQLVHMYKSLCCTVVCGPLRQKHPWANLAVARWSCSACLTLLLVSATLAVVHLSEGLRLILALFSAACNKNNSP